MTRSLAAGPYSPAIASACAPLIRPRCVSSHGWPIWARTRRPAVIWPTVIWPAPAGPARLASARLTAAWLAAPGWPARTRATRSRIARSGTGSGGLASSPVADAATASRSASASPGSPAPRSSRGRSPGSTQTSGLTPAWPAMASRSCATAPSDRSSTVTWPPAASRRRGEHGRQRGPAGQRATRDIEPVDHAGQGHPVPLPLRLEGPGAGLPVTEPPGVLLLPAGQPALLGRAGPGHAPLFRRHPGAQVPEATRDTTGTRHRDGQETRDPGGGQRRVQHAGRAQRPGQGGQRGACRGAGLQRPARRALLALLGQHPPGIQPLRNGRDRAPRRRARIRVHQRVLPAEVDPVLPRGGHGIRPGTKRARGTT